MSAASLTSKDKKDLKHAVLNEVDYIAISFPRCADDMLYAKKLIKKPVGTLELSQKLKGLRLYIEQRKLSEVSDCIMVARGDLGVEIAMKDYHPRKKC